MSNFKGFNNLIFLKKINPIKALLLGFFIWFCLFFTAPLKLNISINLDAYLLIFISVLAFIFGALLYESKKKYYVLPKSRKYMQQLFFIVFLLALLGLVAKFTDRFILRGISLSSDYFANRKSMEGEGGNALAIISAILSPLGIIPLFLMWRYELKFRKIYQIIIFILFFSQIFDALLLGSRSGLFVLFIIFGLYSIYFKKFKITFSRILLLLSVVFSFLLLMNFIFVERTKEFAGEKVYDQALFDSNFNYTNTSNQEFKQDFEKLNSFNKTLAFTYITTVQYFTHGIFEYSYLFDNFKKDYALGSYTFDVYSRFLFKLTGEVYNSEEIKELAPRQGVYTSLFGPLFIDFGWFTIIFMLFFGKFVRWVYEKSKNGSDWAILMYFYFFVVLIFSPVFNFINGAGGLFLFSSIILFRIISNRFYKKIYFC